MIPRGPQLDAEISRLAATVEETGKKFGFRSIAYKDKLRKLKELRNERLKRQTNFRKRKYRRAA